MTFSWGLGGFFRLQKINLLLTSTLWSPWLSAASRADPYYLTTLPSTSFPPFSQLQAAPTTLDHRCYRTICDINLHLSAGFGGGKKRPPVYLPTSAKLAGKEQPEWLPFIIHVLRRPGLLHSVSLESGSVLQWPAGSRLCSNKVSGVLLVMITDVTGSRGSGCPCTKKKEKVVESSPVKMCVRGER